MKIQPTFYLFFFVYCVFVLTQANFKFTEQIADKLLPILRDEKFFDDLGDRLYALFSQDSRFSRPTFERQMSVIRGQVS